MSKTEILFPVGRMVQGDMYEAQTKDAAGGLRVVKSGPRAGQPNPTFFFAVAIPKIPGHTHWAQTDWGSKIWGVGHAAFPSLVTGNPPSLPPKFAWKIVDGDSQVPNEKGRPPFKNEGFPGCWVVLFSSTFAPKLHQFASGAVIPLPEPKAIKRGYYIEVFGTVDGNEQVAKPGIYINHFMVCLRGFGPEITSGPDATAVGFGAAQLPQGASSVPASAMQPPPPAAGAPGAPPAPPVPAAVAVAPPVVAAPPAPTAVAPHPGFMAPPVPGAQPAAPPPPPPPPAGPTWKGPAGSTQAAYAAVGWTEAQMRAQGYL